MGRLVYAALTSLDGFVSDEKGRFDWAMPTEEVHRYVNDLESASRLSLYGRGMYEVMSVWEDMPSLDEEPQVVKDYAALWKRTRKIVFSRSLAGVTTSNTILKRRFDRDEVKGIIEEEEGDIGIGGATLASLALGLGLLDEIVHITFPVLIGAGKRWISAEGQVRLKKLEVREFAEGIVMSRHLVLR